MNPTAIAMIMLSALYRGARKTAKGPSERRQRTPAEDAKRRARRKTEYASRARNRK